MAFHWRFLAAAGAALFAAMQCGSAQADLSFLPQTTQDSIAFLVVKGRFEASDNLAEFTKAVASVRPAAVTFDSPGGNVAKAIELGRLIRAFGISTIQTRSMDCASACSLAFLGGVTRVAEPGSIGVHKSSFSDTAGIRLEDAVSMVQQLTAEVIGYITEMGVDPGLLQLSLSYDSDDIRYLSGSEMAKFRITTGTNTALPKVVAPSPPSDSTPARPSGLVALGIPQARNGVIQHPKGEALVKAAGNPDSANVGRLANDTAVSILSKSGDWYEVSSGNARGYMHYSWVWVKEFEENQFGKRYIQVRSFDNLAAASDFVRSSSLPLAAHLAANGWFAITLASTYPESEAREISSALKAKGAIPQDSMITFGNTYVRKVCCE